MVLAPRCKAEGGAGCRGEELGGEPVPVTLALAQLARGQVLGAGLTLHRQIQDTLLWTLL